MLGKTGTKIEDISASVHVVPIEVIREHIASMGHTLLTFEAREQWTVIHRETANLPTNAGRRSLRQLFLWRGPNFAVAAG